MLAEVFWPTGPPTLLLILLPILYHVMGLLKHIVPLGTDADAAEGRAMGPGAHCGGERETKCDKRVRNDIVCFVLLCLLPSSGFTQRLHQETFLCFGSNYYVNIKSR